MSSENSMEGERIAKVLARAGIASRRESERLITAGRITVNGKVLTTAAFTVTSKDEILFDNEPIAAKEPPRLWRYHKPSGLMTTHKDPKGRPTVFENLPDGMPRVISIGRLDMTSEGLLLLTNDGELARQLELPSTAWARKYRARAYGRVTQEQLDTLMKGVVIDGVRTGPIEAVLDQQKGDNAWISVTIREGKNREVRRAMESLGLQVNRLMRLAYGPFQLGALAKGEVDEVQRRILRDQVGHMVEIPKGRPTVAKTGPRTTVKLSKKTDAAKPGLQKNSQKKDNSKWGKEKSAQMRAAKRAEDHRGNAVQKTSAKPGGKAKAKFSPKSGNKTSGAKTRKPRGRG